MKEKLRELSQNRYVLSSDKSQVEIHLYLSRSLLEEFTEDEAIYQLYNASLLPGVVSPVIGMPIFIPDTVCLLAASWQRITKRVWYRQVRWNGYQLRRKAHDHQHYGRGN